MKPKNADHSSKGLRNIERRVVTNQLTIKVSNNDVQPATQAIKNAVIATPKTITGSSWLFATISARLATKVRTSHAAMPSQTTGSGKNRNVRGSFI